MKIVDHECIWQPARHCAFTDLVTFKGQTICALREGTDHISNDGKIRVLAVGSDAVVEPVGLMAIGNWDLRDPKLSVTHNGRLLLMAYARKWDKHGRFAGRDALYWLSDDGRRWISHKSLNIKEGWLWRLSWHRDLAYGMAYHRKENRIDLYSGQPGVHFGLHRQSILSKSIHGLGYPNESDIVFNENRAFAVVRRDADTCTAQLGTSQYPFYHWQWFDLGEYIGGPAMKMLSPTTAIIGGRKWTTAGPKTAIWTLNVATKALTCELTLPSAGDNSYPGLVIKDDCLWISYYSSHESENSRIYLAKIEL